LVWTPNVASATRAALAAGAPILCDSRMVAGGVIRRGLPADNRVEVLIDHPGTDAHAEKIGNTRSAAAVDLWDLAGAVVVIGNAPTALFRLFERLIAGAPPPSALLAFPVGFVGAEESKAALVEHSHGIPFMTLPGRRGGSAMAAAALNGATLGLRGDGT
jgi:precorrin-8X/cobalt-precorrin-8 methylmutase